MMDPLRVVWQAIWGGRIALSSTAEAVVAEMERNGAYVMLRPVEHAFAGPVRDPDLRRASARPVEPDAPQISYVPPDLFDLSHPGYKIGFTMLEVTGIPSDWVQRCNAMDEIFVPSEFNRQTFARNGVQRPITVVPLGLDPARFHPHGPAHKLEGYFTFLSLFEWGERKAPEVLLRAFNAEFDASEKVVLLVKTDNRDPGVNVAGQVRQMKLQDHRAPIVFLYNQTLPEAQLATLYRSADCFVLPTRGEGWGMPILEAMACGLPVIATDWSAHREFITADNSYPLRVRSFIPARAKCPYYAGFEWADPDIEHLRHLMRYVYQHRDEARHKGMVAAEEVLSRWTWRQTAKKIETRLRQIRDGQ